MVQMAIDPPTGRLAALDRVLALVERRRLSATELRVLLRLVDLRAGLPELAEALGRPPNDVRCAARSLASRGLVRWIHAGERKQTQLAITARGLAALGAIRSASGDEEPVHVEQGGVA
jgi:DNA-binding MarR family transcriptional regulator